MFRTVEELESILAAGNRGKRIKITDGIQIAVMEYVYLSSSDRIWSS